MKKLLMKKLLGDERLKPEPNDDEVLSITRPFEELPTSRMQTVGAVGLPERLIQPKFTIKQNASRQIEPPAALRKVESSAAPRQIEAPAAPKQRAPIVWKPGTFGFSDDDSEKRAKTAAPLALVSSHEIELDNRVSVLSTQKAGQAFIIRLLCWAIPVPIVFLVTALLTRYLGPTEYGEYSFTFTFFTAFSLLSGTGMDQLFIRKLTREARTEWGNTLGYAVGTRLLSTTVVVFIVVLIALVLPINTTMRSLLLLGSVWLFFSFSVNTVGTAYASGFIAEQKIGKLSFLTMTNRIVTSGLVVLVVLLHLSLVWAYALIIYSDLPFFIILVILVQRHFGVRIHFSLARTREYLLGSLPLTGHDALAMISGQADILLLIILTSPLSVGLYALATKLTAPLLSIAYAYLDGLYPLLCVRFEEGREQFTRVYHESVRIIALVVIPLAIFISVEASSIITLLGGQAFAPAAVALQLLMVSTAVTFLQQLTARACTAANLERRMPYMSAIAVAVNLVANLMLIPHWLFIGAAFASLLSSVISLCLFSLLLRHQLQLLPVIKTLLRVCLGNLPMLLFMVWQQQSPFLLTTPVALLLTIAGCLATRTLSLQDIHSLQHILRMRKNREDACGQAKSDDIHQQPTVILPSIKDIADYPTFIMPSIRV